MTTNVRALSRGPVETPATVLRRLADSVGDDEAFDLYGEGALVADLEKRVAALLGKEAALFSISGRAVQLAALRVHADARGARAIAAHPRSHIVEDEHDAASLLFGLRVVRVGSLVEPFTLEHVGAVAEPIAAVTVELPLRRVGYRVPAWTELVEIAAHARGRGAALHFDGARLWETAPGYGRDLDDICALADSVYVSFYKSLGGLAGAALAGDAATIAAARVWLTRAGAVLYRALPYVLAARAGLERELPLMPMYHARARELALALHGIDGIAVSPDPPVCNAFVVHVAGTRRSLDQARTAVIERDGIDLFGAVQPTAHPAICSFEVVVGRNAVELETGAIRSAVEHLAAVSARLDSAEVPPRRRESEG